MKVLTLLFLLLAPALALATPRTSNNYSLAPEGLVSGGQSSSASYALDGAIDSSSGPVATSANYTLKPGYVGQLYDVVSVTVSAAISSVNEGDPNQMTASALLDDDSTLALAANDVAWSVVIGPVSGVSAAGLAQTVPTFTDMVATIRADLGAFNGTGDFTVVNVNPDDTGPVAGDGIDDGWQFENFDANNDDELDGTEAANADPNANPDNDPNTNDLEWLSGFDPNDPASFFSWLISGKTGPAVEVVANKVIPGTVYNFQSTLDLENGPWATVDSLLPGAEALDQPFSHAAATELERWYRFELEKAP